MALTWYMNRAGDKIEAEAAPEGFLWQHDGSQWVELKKSAPPPGGPPKAEKPEKAEPKRPESQKVDLGCSASLEMAHFEETGGRQFTLSTLQNVKGRKEPVRVYTRINPAILRKLSQLAKDGWLDKACDWVEAGTKPVRTKKSNNGSEFVPF